MLRFDNRSIIKGSNEQCLMTLPRGHKLTEFSEAITIIGERVIILIPSNSKISEVKEEIQSLVNEM